MWSFGKKKEPTPLQVSFDDDYVFDGSLCHFRLNVQIPKQHFQWAEQIVTIAFGLKESPTIPFTIVVERDFGRSNAEKRVMRCAASFVRTRWTMKHALKHIYL